MFMKKVLMLLVISMIGFLLALKPSHAENKSHTAVVSFGAGSVFDLLCRSFWAEYDKLNSTKTVILNRPGAGGVLALRTITTNEADVMCIGSGETIYSSLEPDRKDVLETLDIVAKISDFASIMTSAVHPAPKSIQDLQKLSQSSNKPLKVGVVAKPHQYIIEFLAAKHNFNIKVINYKIAQEALPELFSGELDFFMDSGFLTSQAKPWNPDGKLHGYAYILDGSGHSTLKDIPNFANDISSLGDFPSWFGIAVSKNLTVQEKQRVAEAYEKIIQNPQFTKTILEKFPFILIVNQKLTYRDIMSSRDKLKKAVSLEK